MKYIFKTLSISILKFKYLPFGVGGDDPEGFAAPKTFKDTWK